MTDSLRTRIAAVVYRELEYDGDDFCGHLADVLIRELGLKRASRPNDYQHVNYPPGYQYITDWIADE